MIATRMLEPFPFLGYAQTQIASEFVSFNVLTAVSVNGAGTEVTFVPFNGPYYLVVTGQGLTVSGYDLTGGIVDGVQLRDMATSDVAVQVTGIGAMASDIQLQIDAALAGGFPETPAEHFEALLFGSQDQLVTGSAGDDFMHGGAGNDMLRGLGGYDVFAPGFGADAINGGGGGNRIDMTDADSALGDMTLKLNRGTMSFSGGSAQTFKHIVDVTAGSGNDLLAGDERNNTLFGNDGDDEIRGAGGNDILWGNGGKDTILGGTGDDQVFGGAQNDAIVGNDGNDDLFGDSGNDRLFGSAGRDYLSGGDGRDVLYGEEGNDRIDGGARKDQIEGGPGQDLILAGHGADTVAGGGGNDTIFGNAGDDRLIGGGGNDIIHGGPGADDIDGRSGDDRLTGGGGGDIFDYWRGATNGNDRIFDFGSADIIHLDSYTPADVEIQGGTDAVIVFSGGTIAVEGILPELLQVVDLGYAVDILLV